MNYFQDNELTLSEEKCKLIIKYKRGKNAAKCLGDVSIGSGNKYFWIIRISVYKNYTAISMLFALEIMTICVLLAMCGNLALQ